MSKNKYDRKKVYDYAKKWAYSRNPKYYDYSEIGGDCTNFVSQCIFAGYNEMNFNYNGWYYINANQKSPSWTGVEFLYNFLISNQGKGPRGKIVEFNEIDIGDVIQLKFNNNIFTHSLVVIKRDTNFKNILIAAHTLDSFGKSLNEYDYDKYRCIHVEF